MQKTTTQADFTYHITPATISILDTGKGRRSVTNDIEAVLRKIEYSHQGSIAAFKIMYRNENGVWAGVRWTVNTGRQVERRICELTCHPSDPKDVFWTLFLG